MVIYISATKQKITASNLSLHIKSDKKNKIEQRRDES